MGTDVYFHQPIFLITVKKKIFKNDFPLVFPLLIFVYLFQEFFIVYFPEFLCMGEFYLCVR